MAVREYQCQSEECAGERVEVEAKVLLFKGVELDFSRPFCPKCKCQMVYAPTSMSFALKGDWPGKKIRVQRGPK
jgi:hypothetical protein